MIAVRVEEVRCGHPSRPVCCDLFARADAATGEVEFERLVDHETGEPVDMAEFWEAWREPRSLRRIREIVLARAASRAA